MAKRYSILELARRRTRAGRSTAFLLIVLILSVGLYVTYQYQMSRKHGHTFGKVVSKMLSDEKSKAYLCKIRLDNGNVVSATCNADSIEGSRVNLLQIEPHGDVLLYQVQTQ